MHIFRVVSPDLPSAFAHSAAYGDIIAATLALLSLLSPPRGAGVVMAWIFNLWGSADLLNAFYQANHSGLLAGQLEPPISFRLCCAITADHARTRFPDTSATSKESECGKGIQHKGPDELRVLGTASLNQQVQLT